LEILVKGLVIFVFVSYLRRQTGAIHVQIITKPLAIPSKLAHNGRGGRSGGGWRLQFWLVSLLRLSLSCMLRGKNISSLLFPSLFLLPLFFFVFVFPVL